MKTQHFSFILFLFSNIILLSHSVNLILDPEGKYNLAFELDLENFEITFAATVETQGFVGFGISEGGGMTGADIVIGGVHTNNGTSYFADRHALFTGGPPVDDIQNWELLAASENSTHTYLEFRRLLDTGDAEQDVAIKNTTTNIIWSFGSTDRIVYHGPNRGTFPINFMDAA